MKTNTPSYTRVWASRLIAAGLGISGLTCLGGTPPGNGDNGDKASGTLSWEDQFTQHMQHIQKEMDDLFRDSMSNLDTVDHGLLAGPKFDASASVQDRGSNYVATFSLPQRDLSNVQVNVKGDTLSVEASAEQRTKSDPADKGNPSSETEMLNQYEQLVTLPGPVDAAKMTVDKHGDSIVVTLPKKEEKTAAK